MIAKVIMMQKGMEEMTNEELLVLYQESRDYRLIVTESDLIDVSSLGTYNDRFDSKKEQYTVFVKKQITYKG